MSATPEESQEIHVNPRRIVLPAVLALAAGTFFASSFASTSRAAASATAAIQEPEESELEEIMEGIKADMKSLGKSIEARDQDAAWKAVCSLQGHLLAAKQHVPPKAESVAEEERPAFVAAFRTRISQVLKASCDAEAAVLGGKFDDADKVVKEVIWPMQKPAHKQFRND